MRKLGFHISLELVLMSLLLGYIYLFRIVFLYIYFFLYRICMLAYVQYKILYTHMVNAIFISSCIQD